MTEPTKEEIEEAVKVEAASFNWKRANERSVHSALSTLLRYYRSSQSTIRAQGEEIASLVESRWNEAWQHAACLSIAEGYADDGKEISNQSLAMKAVIQLRRDYLRLLHKFDGGNTPFVCAAHQQYACSGCKEKAESSIAAERATVASCTEQIQEWEARFEEERKTVAELRAKIEAMERTMKSWNVPDADCNDESWS